MKKIIAFFNEYSKLITKFWIYQVTMSVLGLMVSWPLAIMLKDDPKYSLYMTLAVICTAGFFCFLVYDSLNQFGLKYSIRKSTASELPVPEDSIGLKIAAFAYAPTALLILIYFIFFLCGFGQGQGVMVSVIYIVPIHSMYNAGWLALSGQHEVARMVFTIATLIPASFFSWLGFYLGVRNKGVLFREKVNKE